MKDQIIEVCRKDIETLSYELITVREKMRDYHLITCRPVSMVRWREKDDLIMEAYDLLIKSLAITETFLRNVD